MSWSSPGDAISEKGGREVAKTGRGKSESGISEGSSANQNCGGCRSRDRVKDVGYSPGNGLGGRVIEGGGGLPKGERRAGGKRTRAHRLIGIVAAGDHVGW